MKITSTHEVVVIATANRHNSKSHSVDFSVGLTNTQKDLLKGAVQQDPLASCNSLRRGLERSSPDHRISHNKLKLAQKLVGTARREIMLPILNGIPQTGKYSEFADLAISKDLGAAIKKHNADPVKHHLGLHDVYCTSHNIRKDQDLHFAFTTPHLLLNGARALAHCWPVGLHMDAGFKFCQYQLMINFLGWNSLGSHFNTWLYSFGSSENQWGYRDTLNGGICAFQALLRCVRDCGDENCDLCSDNRLIKLEPAVKSYMQSAQFTKDPAKRGMPLDYVNADNNPSVAAAVEQHDVPVNICTAHSGAIQKKTEADINKFVDGGPLETKQKAYDAFYEFIRRMINITEEYLVEYIQDRMVDWLLEMGQAGASKWWSRFWTGQRGRCCLAHIGVGGARANCGTEGSVGAFKKGTLRDYGLSVNQSVNTFVAATFIHVQAHSKEHRDKLLVSVDGVSSFQKLPCPDRECWVSITRLHPFAMALIDTLVDKPDWDKGIAKLYSLHTELGDHMELGDRLVCYQEQYEYGEKCFLRDICTNMPNEFLFPNEKWFKRIDPKRKMSLRGLQDQLEKDAVNYHIMMTEQNVNPPEDGVSVVDDWTLAECMDAIEVFHSIKVPS